MGGRGGAYGGEVFEIGGARGEAVLAGLVGQLRGEIFGRAGLGSPQDAQRDALLRFLAGRLLPLLRCESKKSLFFLSDYVIKSQM